MWTEMNDNVHGVIPSANRMTADSLFLLRTSQKFGISNIKYKTNI